MTPSGSKRIRINLSSGGHQLDIFLLDLLREAIRRGDGKGKNEEVE